MKSNIDPKSLYRRRQTIDELRKCVNTARNSVGPVLELLRPVGDDHAALHARLHEIDSNLRALQESLRCQSLEDRNNLETTTEEQSAALIALDNVMQRQEAHLCRWLQFQIDRPKRAWKQGDLGDLPRPFDITFELASSVDPEYSEVWYPLRLRARFPWLKVARFNGDPNSIKFTRPRFEFGQWSCEEAPTARYLPDVKSQVLSECCWHTPEIAHLASFIMSCTFAIHGGATYAFNLEHPEELKVIS